MPGIAEHKRLEALQEERSGVLARMESLLAQESMGDDEEKEYDGYKADLSSIDKRIARENEFLAEQAKAAPMNANRRASEKALEGHHIIGKVKDNFVDDPKCGYKSHRDFLFDVMSASRGAAPSSQLKFLAAAGSDEGSTLHDAYGGYLVPEGFMPGVKTVAIESDPTAGLVTQMPMAAPVVRVNARKDRNQSSQVGGGVSMYRGTETQSTTSSRMAFDQIKFEANSLLGLSYASEELLERSAVSFVALLDQGFAEARTAKVVAEKISGTGAGQPLGILNADCLISIAKEGGQSADTINATNLKKMRARIWNYGTAIWMANHDTYLQLIATHTALTNSDAPLFVHGNGTDVPDTLLGRPIVFTDHAKTLGDLGDIMLCNWSEYVWATLGSATPTRAESMHVRFINNERTFRFTEYNDGQPMWLSALTPPNSTTTRSPFVALAERA